MATGAAAAAATAATGTGGASADDGRYTALALQTVCDAVNKDKTREAARTRMDAAISRIAAQIASGIGFLKTFNGAPVRLVVLPEYFLTGFPLGETMAEWLDKAALEIDGPEYERLGEIAQRHKLFLAGNVYEADPNFPEVFFQTCFVISDAGDVILRYRRLVSLYSPTPYDVWDKYLEIYGLDGVFPVAKTEIGTLAPVASEEILYPELARCFAMRGAEIFAHSTSEVGSPALTQKDIAKRARAIENMAYVVSANSAEIIGYPIPAASTDAMSKVVNYDGKVMAEAGSGETVNANAIIDLPALRAYRRRSGMSHFLSRQPFAAYAESYAGHAHDEPNGFMREGGVKPLERNEIIARQQGIIDRLVAEGVIR
ncbi:MAG: nitrilase-related carbon-nitrogen hydrolase [Pseudomonadota bacterium]